MQSLVRFGGISLLASSLLLAFAGGGIAEETQPFQAPPLPQRLSETGLYVAGNPRAIDTQHVAFSPQYPLWSDGALKRRWMALPAGTSVDATNADAWEFPRGVRFWKEFAVDGKPVETRFIERLQDGTWRFSTYAWDADGRDATLVAARGGVAALANGGRYILPSRDDCRACHEGGDVPILGFSAMQLSADRDPNAVHAERSDVSLQTLSQRGVLQHLPKQLLDAPPRIVASSPQERAALGYLHGNCGNCHNASDAGVPLPLDLQQRVTAANATNAPREALTAESRFRISGTPGAKRWIEPGRAQTSVLALRMHLRDANRQMPPIGSQQVDTLGVALIDAWINALPAQEPEHD